MSDSMCCSHLKCQWFCNRKLFLCHKYQANMEPFPKERDAFKTQLHCPFKPSVSHCVHLHELGEQARLLFCRLKEHTVFFSFSLGFHRLERRTNSCRAFFCGLLFNISNWPSALLQLKHLCSYWIDIWGTAVCEWGLIDVINTQQKHIQ